MGKINSLKKIRKKEEAFFGKDLQFLRIAFFEPNSYKHFQKGFEIYQKLELICSKSSKFKKEVFTNFKDEFKKGLKILELLKQKNDYLDLKDISKNIGFSEQHTRRVLRHLFSEEIIIRKDKHNSNGRPNHLYCLKNFL